MKSLQQYICEAMEKTVLRNLSVKYDGPDELFVQVPERMGESDVQIYLDDTMLKLMPAESHIKDFGVNEKNLSDSYFEYEKMETSQGVNQKADILWDKHYDQSMNGGNMHVLRISGLKYVMAFDQFELENIEDDKVKETLYELFNGMIADDKNLPFDLALNEDNIEWK